MNGLAPSHQRAVRAFGQLQTKAGHVEAASVRSASPEEAASILEAASSVIICAGLWAWRWRRRSTRYASCTMP